MVNPFGAARVEGPGGQSALRAANPFDAPCGAVDQSATPPATCDTIHADAAASAVAIAAAYAPVAPPLAPPVAPRAPPAVSPPAAAPPLNPLPNPFGSPESQSESATPRAPLEALGSAVSAEAAEAPEAAAAVEVLLLSPPKVVVSPSSFTEEISSGLHQLLASGKHSDVLFRAEPSSIEMRAHRLVLEARCGPWLMRALQRGALGSALTCTQIPSPHFSIRHSPFLSHSPHRNLREPLGRALRSRDARSRDVGVRAIHPPP